VPRHRRASLRIWKSESPSFPRTVRSSAFTADDKVYIGGYGTGAVS
jgi:hypothetical protein